MMSLQDRFFAYLLSFHHKPYIWGGDDPTGFDCSGLVTEWLQMCGVLPHKSDFSAQGLYLALKDRQTMEPKFGTILFYGGDMQNISHVNIALDMRFFIGAEGGTSSTKTLEDAKAANAFIKIRPIRSRGNLVAMCNPKYPWEVI